MKARPIVLICDDDESFILSVKQCLRAGYECRTARNGDEALAIVRAQRIDILMLDIQMRTPTEGIDFLPRLLEADADLSIVMSSARTDFEAVREAMRLGATDYVPKHCEPEELLHSLARVVEKRALLKNRDQLTYEARAARVAHGLIGKSRAILELRKLLDKIRASELNVLITGETGTGKEVVARNLRGTLDDGSPAPFISIDSSTISATLAEGTLFGYERGAFTGAEKTTKGVFEEAQDGIVYFDEIGNMPLEIQAKLLRVLQEKEVTRLGSSRAIPLAFRVVAATNRDLGKLVAQGLFKDDLRQRLNVIPIELPPLRERSEDIPLLIAHFAARVSRGDRTPLRFHPDAVAVMQTYPWPGNIRELGNVVAYLAATAEAEEIDVADLPPALRAGGAVGAGEPGADRDFYRRVGEFERTLLAAELDRHQGNISRMALALGMDRSHLYTKLREHRLHPLR